jgi:multiple sugar transport system ATP-binding protein
MAHVLLKQVHKIYDRENGTPHPAVQNFNLEVKDREFVVFVGPSGCGKSTTLRMIAGLEEISQGDIFIGDRRVNDLPPKDRDIAMVFQNYALYPHMNVFDNLAFGLKLRKFSKAEIKKRVFEAASILGIERYLDSKPKALSGGERQRVAVGRAIVRQPKVFLFDEPLSNLDAKMRVQMRTEIIKLHRRLNATMIYVTHDQVEAMTMGDRIVVMKDGVIQQTDAPLSIYRQPDNLFVAGFLGSPAMNFIPGRLSASGGRLNFHEADGGTLEFDLSGLAGANAFAGREVVAGIRPEDIEIVTETEPQRGLRFRAVVDLVEHMGAESNVHLHTGAHLLIMRTEAPVDNDNTGHRMQFEVDPAKVHLFDPGTTRRITA